MYPVKLGYEVAKKRIKKLLDNGHYAEALVTSVFSAEKTLRRTLRQLIVSAGFSSKQADCLMSNIRGLVNIKKTWKIFDPQQRELVKGVIGIRSWSCIKEASEMRNKLIHGERVYSLKECEKRANQVLRGLDQIVTSFNNVYGYCGWSPYSRRLKPQLHIDPKVTLAVAPQSNCG